MIRKSTIFLAIILLFGFYLRTLSGLKWDQGLLLHPDERFLTMVAAKVTLPNSILKYLDSNTNPLSPYNNGFDYYVYGNLPLTITKILAKAVNLDNYDNIFLVGRVLSSVFDLGAIICVFLIGNILCSTAAGLIAAILLCLSVQNIQLSHFMGTENFVGFFVVLTALLMTLASKSYEENKLRKTRTFIALSGISIGLGLASKISAAFFIPASLVILLQMSLTPSGDYLRQGQIRQFSSEIFISWSLIFLAFAVITFRIAQPSAFEGLTLELSHNFLDNMRKIKEITDGGEWPPNVQWAGRAPVLFTLKQMFLYEMGPGVFISTFIGVLYSIVYGLKRKKWLEVILAFWVIFFLGYQSTRFVKYGRYLSIIYPFLALFGGILLSKYINTKKEVLAYILIGAAVIWAAAFNNIYHHDHTRIAASRWIYDNVPNGSVIGSEMWDDTLPLRIDGKDGFGGMYKEKSFNYYEIDSDKKRDELVNQLSQVDYLILSSNRQFASIPRLTKRYPFTSIFYQQLFTQNLGFKLVHTEERYPSFMGISFSTKFAVESFTVYDHPQVYIFKKESFDKEKLKSMLLDFPNGHFQTVISAKVEEISWIK